MLSLRSFCATLNEIKWYIALACVLFVGGYFIGHGWSGLETFLKQQLEGIGQIKDSLSNSSNKELSFFVFIFYNNALKAIFIMFAGIAFGLLPLGFLIINGMVIGFLIRVMSENNVDLLTVVVRGLLPHGILEIPAILIAAAFGMRFGVLVLQRMSKRYRSNTANPTIGMWTKKTAAGAVWITLVLLVAAIIESTITFWLMSGAA
ncbi:stage II sporulation protein M [Paenibacillus sp. UMB4589-SE434]|uniref:stage II sporulation protein M n=1 Tax=Paenibacillus sp. UMB4589-SE434 TaxID=3046314 RepID=UPI00254A2616|nr:stage II sporulation protein M [Paenibacillus sp. UMB4589-SE434]MDK8184210.1 stage II sporulation protein M [Paenibacillus sp. UMB4589-SE434]